MGLDTTHNAWHGPYSSFNDFRRWLASRIGIDLSEYTEYGKFEKTGPPHFVNYVETGTKDLKDIDHDIQPLIDHSDCDGSLRPDECFRIANGLKSIIDKVTQRERNDPAVGNHYNEAVQFRLGCLAAYSKNETLEFH